MRIDLDTQTGHISIGEWLAQEITRDRWKQIIDGVNNWFMDREILTYTVFSPDRLAFPVGKLYRHDVGSHKTLRIAAKDVWGCDEWMSLNQEEEDGETSLRVQVWGRCLATRVKTIHITASLDQVSMYIPDMGEGGTLQAFEFKPRCEEETKC
jgi:hypothetical protein